jgi:hypothetical protein
VAAPVVGAVLGGEFAIAPGAITIGRRPRLVSGARSITGRGAMALSGPQLGGVAQMDPLGIVGTGPLMIVAPHLDGRGVVDNFARARRAEADWIDGLADVA